ncbi:hypothetical protein C4565_04910 [Candidatus Parcubacteria bacterium]|nr:MAG: hypothetical protein C4565_04910 [Candidatus Parcubacteria bacterium]
MRQIAASVRKVYENRPISGAILEIDESGFIERVLIIANDEHQQTVIVGALARIIRPPTWGWFRRLIGKRSS